MRHDAAVVRERESRGAAGGLGIPFGWQLALWLVLALMVAAGAGLLLWWGLGRPDFRGGTLNPRERLELIKIALAVTGGIGGVVALVVAYRRQQLNEAEHLREATKLFNERYASAVDQLGSDKAAIRLGGVYAMAGLSDDWEAGRQKCIDVLCAYLRMPYSPPVDPDDDEARQGAGIEDKAAWSKEQSQRSEERQVRHTVIRLIRDHLRNTAPGRPGLWCGHDFDFTGAVFDGGDFSEAVFSGGQVNFNAANFTGSEVSFAAASFSGSKVDFNYANFTGGHVYFNAANFTGGTINFNYANFTGSQVYFFYANFTGGTVNFNYANFTGGEVSFFGADFSGGGVDFYGANFSGGTVDLSRPRRYDKPPYFDAWEDGPPEGLLLPPTHPAASQPAVEVWPTPDPNPTQ